MIILFGRWALVDRARSIALISTFMIAQHSGAAETIPEVVPQLPAPLQAPLGNLLNVDSLRRAKPVGGSLVYVNGYHTSGDGGGGMYQLDASDSTSADNGGNVIIDGRGARWKLAPAFPTTVRTFGAKGNGQADDSDAFRRALLSLRALVIPEGIYRISGGLVISQNGMKIRGAGTTATKILIDSSNLSGITLKPGLNNIELSGFTLTREKSPVAGAYGIDFTQASVGQSLLKDLIVERHFRNIGLGPTDYSLVQNVISQHATDVGMYLTNTTMDGTCQWTLDRVLSQKNGAVGIMFRARTGPHQVTLGTWKDISTFANSSNGIAVLGLSSTPVQGVRISGGFMGEDGDSEILLDTYGGQHQLLGTFVELAGRGKTGREFSTQPSNIGSGIEVTPNNLDTQITSIHSNGNSWDGLSLSGVVNIVGNSRATNNGLARKPGRRNGVRALGPSRLIISGGYFGNTGAGTSQQYGANASDKKLVTIVGADMSRNTVASFADDDSEKAISAIESR